MLFLLIYCFSIFVYFFRAIFTAHKKVTTFFACCCFTSFEGNREKKAAAVLLYLFYSNVVNEVVSFFYMEGKLNTQLRLNYKKPYVV